MCPGRSPAAPSPRSRRRWPRCSSSTSGSEAPPAERATTRRRWCQDKCVATWIFEPGHTEAEFRARHMMVTWVRGLFKDIHGRLQLDWDSCLDATFEGEIDATGIWTGEPERDAHLRSADFLDVENHPEISFRGRFTERTADSAFKGEVELTIRGAARTVPL